MRKTSTDRDIERTYFDELGTTPRFDVERESELARAVVSSRRAYWTALLDAQQLDAVLAVIVARGCSADVVALAEQTRGDVGPLMRAIEAVGDEHAAADAIVALAAQCSPSWHREVVRRRDAFLRARNRFVAANLRLVVMFAQRHGRTTMALGDRIQEGNLGLMKAVDRFDPERGVRFSTYAAWWIRHAIVRPAAKLQNASARNASCRGEDDGVDELCDASSLAELEDVVDRRDRVRMLAALAELPDRERDIVHERFALPGATAETFEEIGRRHGISRERARQVQRVALDRLRRKLEPRATLRAWNAA
ncbi:MAG TPA: sigma-70 family RNA polymerase sigma factor [Nannocystaceae bacterium]|nr:sigma-70 family RNA polymerase sigma factor [Nannocystaceae bacterium]